jgi:membrane dipeptidase
MFMTISACGGGSDDARTDEAALAERAAELHDRGLTLDSHDDIPFDFATEAVDPLDADRQVNLEKMRAGGLDAAFFIVFVGQGERSAEGYAAAHDAALTKFEAIHRMADDMYPDRMGLAFSTDDVRRIHAEGRLVAAIGIENGYVIGTDLTLLARYHELGARYMTLAHGGHNDLADSATPREGEVDAEHGGLSDFGVAVVAEMNRLGIMVDVSHVSKAAALEAIRVSRAPVIASHSSSRSLADHPRNLDDETLRALRDNGGVVQIVALDDFLKVQPPERAKAMAELEEAVGYQGSTEGMSHEQKIQYDRGLVDIDIEFPPADLSDFVDHIDYAVQLIGIDHVGISSDFDGGGGVHGWADASETPNVTAELLRRGYSDEAIEKLWGGNLLRVWRDVERVAAGAR